MVFGKEHVTPSLPKGYRGLSLRMFRRYILFVLLLSAALSGFAQARPAAVPFIYFGHVFLADPETMEIRRIGALSLTAPAVAADPRGLVWGRLDKTVFAALDPATGKVVRRVSLPFPVYDHVITPSGKAFVTHASQTKDGFTVSVVDTEVGKAITEIRHIAGLRTDLTTAGETVYLAVAGPERGPDGALRLYELNASPGGTRELLSAVDPLRTLRLAADGPRLYAAWLPRTGSDAPARIEVRDRTTRRVERIADDSLWGEGRRLTGVYAEGRAVYLIFNTDDGGCEIAVADSDLTTIRVRLPMTGPVSRILAVRGAIIMYLDFSFAAGYRDVSLRFYDMNARKEVKAIGIPGWLAHMNLRKAK
jgi:hypothetical protein